MTNHDAGANCEEEPRRSGVHEHRLDDWQDVVTAVRAINDVVLSFPDADVPGAVRGPR